MGKSIPFSDQKRPNPKSIPFGAMAYGYGLWLMAMAYGYGLWLMAYGLWLWLWLMAYGYGLWLWLT